MFLTYTRNEINEAKNMIGDVRDTLVRNKMDAEVKSLDEALHILEGSAGWM